MCGYCLKMVKDGHIHIHGDKKHEKGDKPMKELKMPTKEQVLDCANTCAEAEFAMKALFPEVFEEERETISNDLELELEDRGDGWVFLKIAHQGKQIFRVDKNGVAEYHQTGFKIDYLNNAIKVMKKK